jgi:flagellar assembly factor FliW
MPLVETRHFGVVEYEADAVLAFPAGLPAFDEERRFLVIEQPASAPVVFLQSLARPDLCFITLPVQTVDPAYHMAMSADDLEQIGLPPDRQPRIGEEILCLVMVTVGPDGPPTANLMAPLVVNLSNRQGVQAIQVQGSYSHQHPLEPSAGEKTC